MERDTETGMAAAGDRLPDLLRRGLETTVRAGAAAAKITYRRQESTDCSFEAGRLKSTTSRQQIAYTVEAILGGRRGVASGNDLAGLGEVGERAVVLARMGSVAHIGAFPAPAPTAPVRMYDQSTATWPLDSMVEAAGALAAGLKAYNPALHIQAGAGRATYDGLLVTTGGTCHPARATHWSLWAQAQRTEGTDMLFAGYGRGWCALNEVLDRDYILARILEDLRHGETTVAPPTGKLPVFLDPDGLRMLLWPVLWGIDGRNVAKGDSPLRGRLGEQVLDPCLTLVDEPHTDLRPGCADLDGDGVPTRANTLFEAGVLRQFLYDLDTAGLAGAEPTGNDGCRPYCLTVRPGQQPRAELLAGIADGLYIKGLIGYGQTPNFINGDVSANVGLGYRVRDGRILGRVKNTMVAGNVYDLLKREVRLSTEVDPVEGLPWAVVDGVTVSA